MDNLRTLTRAWQQFDVDHSYLPPNPDDGNTTPGFNWVPGQAGRGGAHEFNPDILTDATRSLLFPYLTDKNATVFRCPDDLRKGMYQGIDPQKRGMVVAAARSYAMNVAIGTNSGTGVLVFRMKLHTTPSLTPIRWNLHALTQHFPRKLSMVIQQKVRAAGANEERNKNCTDETFVYCPGF